MLSSNCINILNFNAKRASLDSEKINLAHLRVTVTKTMNYQVLGLISGQKEYHQRDKSVKKHIQTEFHPNRSHA